jgi:hypothetical protein
MHPPPSRVCITVVLLLACATKPATEPDGVPTGAVDPQAVDAETERLAPAFARVEAAHFDVAHPLLWGFYFLDKDREPLGRVAAALAAQGFRTVQLEPVEGEAGFRLHVEKVEVLSAHGLAQRNLELKALARAHGVEAYDGWDVGKPQ